MSRDEFLTLQPGMSVVKNPNLHRRDADFDDVLIGSYPYVVVTVDKSDDGI